MSTAVAYEDNKTREQLSVKLRKHSANMMQLHSFSNEQRQQPSFGICFDVDGVLARGTVPIPAAISGFKKLVDETGRPRVPVAFVTNSLNLNADKAVQLSQMLGVQVTPDQLIQAQGPLEVFTKLHEKFCLIVGQGKVFDIANELGFKNVCTVEQIAEAYPLLDVVDHDNRKKIAVNGYVEKEFPRVEAIVLLGEPKRWESALQILIDILRSDGRPNQTPSCIGHIKQLPVVACNMDLQFQHSAPMPRYGHGAFLVCLEALYKKITGRDLEYTALVGKPSEITFRYAEHVLTSQSRKLGFSEPLKRMYLIGDTPDSDIVGSNLYQRYVDRLSERRNAAAQPPTIDDPTPSPSPSGPTTKKTLLRPSVSDDQDPELSASRNVPPDATFHEQTVESVESILVRTGVYRDPEPPRTSTTGAGRRPSAAASRGGGLGQRFSSDDSADSGTASSGGEDDDNDDDDDEVLIDEEEESGVTADDDDEELDKFDHGHRDFPNSDELRKPTIICDDVDEAIQHILRKESASCVS